MRENISYSSNDNIYNSNFQDDSMIRKVQENLMMMGFDIIMINKIISNFKIKSEIEALDYLIKTQDGMWNHPFIPKENDQDLNKTSGFFKKHKILMNSLINKIKSIDNINEPKKKISKSVNVINENVKPNNFELDDEICEICGELKEFHTIKNYDIESLNKNTNSYNYNINNINDNVLIDDDDNNIYNNNQNVNINLNLEEEINQNECPICMGEFENPLEIENCKHKFCFECFHSYLVDLINHNKIDKIPCPKLNCENKEISEEFFSNYLSEQEYFKFRTFKSRNQIARDPKKIFCPFCDSYAQIDDKKENNESNNPNYTKSKIKCLNGHEFCSCGRPLHEKECYKEKKEFKEMLKKENIKNCPKCGFLIKKNKGCNHMTCGNPICKYEFCWICMNEAIPDHYNIGPCRGKQFIDTESFLYWLEENHPWLLRILRFLGQVLLIIVLILGFIVLPVFGLIFFSYGFIFETELSEYYINDFVRFIGFLICFLLSFPYQSIVYNCFIILFLILINIKYILVIVIFLITIFIILIVIYRSFNSRHFMEINNNSNNLIEVIPNEMHNIINIDIDEENNNNINNINN